MLKKVLLINLSFLFFLAFLFISCSKNSSVNPVSPSISTSTTGIPSQMDCFKKENDTKRLILWNKLGSDHEVKHSIIRT